MVLCHFKKNEELQFIYECTIETNIDDLTKSIVDMYNKILKIHYLVKETADIVKYGLKIGNNPAKIENLSLHEHEVDSVDPDEKKIIIEEIDDDDNDEIDDNDTNDNEGKEMPPHIFELITKTIQEALASCSKEQAEKRVALTSEALQIQITTLKEVLFTVYPLGFSAHEPIQMLLDDSPSYDYQPRELQQKKTDEGEKMDPLNFSREKYDSSQVTLWWAGKELETTETLKKYIGNNEKTKIIVKLQKKGQGPPVREPTLSDQQQKDMMAFYHRRQEMFNKLQEESKNDVASLSSPWADPASLKNHFHGFNSDIKYSPS